MIRLIIDGYHSGTWNMACDLAVSKCIAQNLSPSTIRLYGWSVPTLSLGTHQKTSNIDLNYLKNTFIDCVRRPTGGRAVLHDKEVTYLYSSASSNPKLPSSVHGSYLVIASALIESMQAIGINCDFQEGKKDSKTKDICYDSASLYEITVEDKKFIGSAQYRNDKFVMQHGSIPVYFDYYNYVHSFKLANKDKMIDYLKENVIDVNDILHRDLTFEEVAFGFKKGFEKVFEEEVVFGTFSKYEIELTKKLLPDFESLL